MKKLTSILLALSLSSSFSIAQEGPRGPRPGTPTNPPPGNPPPGNPNQGNLPSNPPNPDLPIEQQLQSIIAERGIQAINPATIDILPPLDPKVQLGKKLFFSKNLGGEQSVACVSCHHPLLGGGDNLSLSVGVDAVDELDNQAHDILGHGRFNGSDNHPVVPRNAPTVFNIALYQRGLFWDSRVQRLRNGAITTPDVARNVDGRRRPDNTLPTTATLADAQARFPVTSAEEMRGSFEDGEDNQTLRSALVARLNNDIANIATHWPLEVEHVYGDQEVTVDRVFEAIGEYERSMLFINNPWENYLAGNTNALTDDQKSGAVLFFTASRQGGAGCVACHSGPNFSDSRHHLVAFPQIGIGKGNTSNNGTSQDFGRENISNNDEDRFHFRTPTLLNVAATAPYGHTGAYQTLEQVIEHYNNPQRAIDRLFAAQGQQAFSGGVAPYCLLPQVRLLMAKHNVNCEEIFPDSYQNSVEVLERLQNARQSRNIATAPLRARPNLSNIQVQQVAAFLHSLTDPCVQSKSCLAPWLLSENDIATFPDQEPLKAINSSGNNL